LASVVVVRLSDSRSEARFRAELSDWLDENQPAADRASDPPRSSGHIPGWASEWQSALFEAGWLVPRWPPELGGRDASAIEQMIYLEELAHRRLPRTVNPVGLDVCAPTLADHGSGVQVDEWVVATLRGQMSWCVAVDDALAPPDPERPRGEEPAPDEPSLVLAEAAGGWTLRGRVAGPPGAGDADRCLCGVRTLAGRRETEGVAVVAADLGAPGVVRPDGDGAELVFDDVVVTDDDIVGGRDQGWPVLQSVRARLRSTRWITSLLAIERALAALGDVVRSRGLTEDGAFRDRLAGLQVEADAVRALAYRALAKQESGRPNPELAMLPLATAQVEERVYLAGVDALGADGLDMGLDGPMGWPSGAWATEWAAATDAAVAAGGLGVESDRVAARVLGLRLR
jgi:alkylation response protein AidB-like acyl-CoA dehydrogenase